MTKLYYASPLFTTMEQQFNLNLTDDLKDAIISAGLAEETEIYIPQNNMDINDKSKHAGPIDIFNGDTERLLESDILLAVLDGQVIDPGVACEIGVAVASGIPIIALATDIRTDGYTNKDKVNSMAKAGNTPFFYYNQYVVGAVETCGVVTDNITDFITEVLDEIELQLAE